VIILINEIDGCFHQVFLSVIKCSKQELRQKYMQVKKLNIMMKDLPNVFCRIHNFDQIPYDCDIKVEFVIDTDTEKICSPFY